MSSQGVPSAWSLTDVVSEECNELYASGTSGTSVEGGKRQNDTLTEIVHPVDDNGHRNETDLASNNGTVIDWKVGHGSSTTHDPDSDVEWITAEYESETEADDAVHFPSGEDDSSELSLNTPAHPIQ